MLISFSVGNWQSFRDKATLSMVKTKEKQHAERTADIAEYKLKLLPIAAIYGGNASGKTKFFNALAFAKNFILTVTQPENAIRREPFKLDKSCQKKPSTFSFTFVASNYQCYEFNFAVTEEKVVTEKLLLICKTTEQTLYERKTDGTINFTKMEHKNDQRLQFVAEGTRDNQLFITNSINQKIQYFQPIYDWFKNSLVLISPHSIADIEEFIYEPVAMEEMNKFLFQLDTGIHRLEGKNFPLENLSLPDHYITTLKKELEENQQVSFRLRGMEPHFSLRKKNGEIVAEKLITYHQSTDKNEEIAFDPHQESAGTLRIMDLCPALFDLLTHKKTKVYIIDELDRCLHTLLTRTLLEKYLASCSSQTRTQLIFTTHDVLLMDQDLLRRDEIWVTEKNRNGASSLFSFAEYKEIRADKDIKKSYLQGRLGGIPKIFL